MRQKLLSNETRMIFSYFFVLIMAMPGYAQRDPIDFESEQWELKSAEVTDYLGRKCLKGHAILKNAAFENGVIEVDIAVPEGVRCYPGIVFRMQSDENYEHFYIRPHRSIFYPDALQYAPNINGIGCWQLYNGEGYTAGATIPSNEWLHLKMEISGKQARVYFQDMEKAALVISDLKHGVSKGTIGVFDQSKTAHFSNFRFEVDNNLQFDPPPEVEAPLGMIMEWEISQSFQMSQIDFEHSPEKQGLTDLTWQKVRSEPSGLVNIARLYSRSSREPDCIWAKAFIMADKDEMREFQFGYSDYISIFVNGQILFSGNNAYRSRDPSFLGIVGLIDAIYLPLKRGNNELLLLLTESFGGWGFMFRDAEATFQHEKLAKVWEYGEGFKYPESVVYDAKRNVLYVSNYYSGGNEFISKMNLKGEVENLQWVTGLDRPTGLCLHEDRLYAIERKNLVEIDVEMGEIVSRYPVPEPGFLNDVAFDPSGNAYISDSRRDLIYRFHDGEFEVWLQSDEIKDPNGLFIDKNMLLFGNSGDGCLKSIDLQMREIGTIVCLGPGSIMDGIRADGQGNYIISDFNGRVFHVTPSGQKTELLNTTAPQHYCADFEYVIEENLLIIPTLYDNRLRTYTLKLE